MARIVLMANSKPGVEITKYLQSDKASEIIAIYLSNSYKYFDEEIVKISNLNSDRIFSSKLLNNKKHLAWLEKEEIDFIVTIYWPYLLDEKVYSLAKETINFHPALLPVNRGWYPHVHSIIDGTPTGVTLHSIDKTADTGLIWVQKEVPILLTDDAKSLYLRLQNEIIKLFKINWPLIREGNIKAYPQLEENSSYHRKNEISLLDEIKLNKNYTGKQIIDILRARSFGDIGFAYFKVDEKKIYINIRLSDTKNME
jgi:methionyl-tRNA formyltransferase